MTNNEKHITIAIIGSGNVAYHLQTAFAEKVNLQSISSRTFKNLAPADIYIISVSDSAILEIAENLKSRLDLLESGNKPYVVAHTSGATPRSVLDFLFDNTGVLYPMQTFSRERSIKYDEIPFFIDANNDFAKKQLWQSAELISNKITEADTKMLTTLHIAAVMSCNFVNHLWTLADDFLQDSGLDFKLMYPLIKETYNKLLNMSPRQAQTGPAVRNDLQTIERHRNLLKDSPELTEIYNIITESIIKTRFKQ